MARKVIRLLATAVASLALAAAFTGCGGGGGSPAADPAPVVTPAAAKVNLTKVTLMPSLSGDGMLVDLNATGSNGSDAVADLTAAVSKDGSWTVKVVVVPALADQAKLSVTSAGRVKYDGKDLLVLPDQSAGVEATASLNGSTASVKQTVTVSACGAGLALSGSTCMVAGMDSAKLFYIGQDHAADGSTIANRTFYVIDNDGKEHKLVLSDYGVQVQFCGLSVKLGARGGRLISCNGLAGHEADTGTYEVGSNYLAKFDNVDRRAEADYQRAKTGGWTFINIGTPAECGVVPGLGACYAPMYQVTSAIAASITN